MHKVLHKIVFYVALTWRLNSEIETCQIKLEHLEMRKYVGGFYEFC